eukprot:Pgem_evm1s6070
MVSGQAFTMVQEELAKDQKSFDELLQYFDQIFNTEGKLVSQISKLFDLEWNPSVDTQ